MTQNELINLNVVVLSSKNFLNNFIPLNLFHKLPALERCHFTPKSYFMTNELSKLKYSCVLVPANKSVRVDCDNVLYKKYLLRRLKIQNDFSVE